MEPFSHFPAGAGIADLIDHTLLKAEASRSDIERLCAEARAHGFGAVCVNPVWVPLCRAALDGAGVEVATVVGFPLGASQPETKCAEAALAVAIRTFWLDDVGSAAARLCFGTGAGITWGSDPLREWDETTLKAGRLIELASAATATTAAR